MPIDLGRRLIASGAVPREEVEAALFLSVVRGVPFARALIDRGAISERGLEEELERVGGLGLRQVAGAADLVARVPRAMCRRLSAIPTRFDPPTGVVDVAAADPLDPHVAAEFGFHLGAPIRVLRAPITAIEEEIRRLELDEQATARASASPAPPARARRVTPPFPHGAPQSTIPPPEEPIPLVRKLPAHDGPEEGARAREDEVALPLRHAKFEPDRGRSAPRPARDPAEFPAVSFPSEPPENGAERPSITPPYGTPVLAPPAPPADFSVDPSRSTRRTMRPADLPFALAPNEAPEAPETPPRPTMPGPPPRVHDVHGVNGVPAEPPPPEPPRVRAPDGRTVLEAMGRAKDRDEVVRLALRGMRLVARRLAVFVVKRDGFHGWACNVEFGDPDALRELLIPQQQPSVLATAAAAGTYLGPVRSTPAHEGLLRVMEQPSGDVAAVAVRVGGRPAMILVADDLDDTMLGTKFLGELAQAAGEALARLLGK